ncbi:protein CUSTOS [Hyperolius riggenbachi]|uniref:protein CUSTOS n=1 Tax=Hyperolius riggenbachi TaxID=752182 RepID=UPI0035A2AAF9
MAAPGRNLRRDIGSDSSSSEEERERLKEAAWLPPGVKKRGEDQTKPVVPVFPSLRVRPDNHEHDGNELQTTPEFRAHVAKKLASILDSCIKEIPRSSKFKELEVESGSEDEGFRLFGTSVPGDTGTVTSCTTSKFRTLCSTSEDSEGETERRCREAAVSGLDILRHSALQPGPEETPELLSDNQLTKKCKKKKKKKDKDKKLSSKSGHQQERQEPELSGFKKKKRKKNRELDNDCTQSGLQRVREEDEPSGFKKKKKKEKDKPMTDSTKSDQRDLRQELKSNGLKKKAKKLSNKIA